MIREKCLLILTYIYVCVSKFKQSNEDNKEIETAMAGVT